MLIMCSARSQSDPDISQRCSDKYSNMLLFFYMSQDKSLPVPGELVLRRDTADNDSAASFSGFNYQVHFNKKGAERDV